MGGWLGRDRHSFPQATRSPSLLQTCPGMGIMACERALYVRWDNTTHENRARHLHGRTVMKTLTFQVPDEVYRDCQQVAAKQGRTLDEYVLELLSRNGASPPRKLTEKERREAWDRLRRNAGSQSLEIGRASCRERV